LNGLNSNCADLDFYNAPDCRGLISDPIKKILFKCVEKEPADRYTDFIELRNELKRYKTPQASDRSKHYADRTPPKPHLSGIRPETPLYHANNDCLALPPPVGIYRCATISVTQNHEFAFEFAQRASDKYNLRTIILDFDFEKTLSEWYFQTDNTKKKELDENSLLRIVELTDRTAKGGLVHFTRTRAVKPDIMWFNEPDPEYSCKAAARLTKQKGHLLRRLLSELTINADVCILLTGQSVFCELNARCFENSHYIICPAQAEIPSIKAFNNTALLAERSIGIPADRFKYILWNYQSGDGVKPETMWEFSGESLAGFVRVSRKRDAARRGGIYNKCYARSMESAVKRDYDEIISALGIC
jgi:hypothetical protein